MKRETHLVQANVPIVRMLKNNIYLALKRDGYDYVLDVVRPAVPPTPQEVGAIRRAFVPRHGVTEAWSHATGMVQLRWPIGGDRHDRTA